MGTNVLAQLLPAQRDELELGCDAASASCARRWAVSQPSTQSVPTVDPDVLQVVISELVTNAVMHARRPPIVLSLWPWEGSLVVAVMDGCPEKLPCPVVEGDYRTSGRGLFLVAAETQEWGWFVDSDENVKFVWARI